MTIRELQLLLPDWPLSNYSPAYRRDERPHRDQTHVALHMAKAAGKVAGSVEERDHARPPGEPWESAVKATADLVICALRFAKLEGFDLQTAIVERVKEKSGVSLPA